MSSKHRSLITALAIAMIWLVSFSLSTQGAESVVQRPDAVLIQFEADVTEAQRDEAIQAMGGVLVEWLAPIRVARVQINPTNASAFATSNVSLVSQLETLRQTATGSSLVIAAELDETVQAAFLPNDPAFNNSAFVYAPQRINAPAAWDYTLGNPGVIVAILDTGVNTNHPEFAGRVVAGYDFINGDTDPNDDNGHGTHAAGIAVAGTNNGIGNVGICGGCSLMPVKILSATGSGLWSQVAAGIIYAADNGARVINLSLGGYSPSNTMQSAIEYAQQKGVVVVAAAGNDNRSDPFYPAALPNVIGVSATDKDDARWSLSNYGDYIDVAAPGHIIYSTFNDLNNYYGGYAFYSGTSMAAPHVAGLAGLILSQNPNRTVDEVISLITDSSSDLGASGWDAFYGNGRIDAFNALSQDAPPTGMLSGLVWMDSSGDGIHNINESAGVAQVEIRVNNTTSGIVYTTSTRSNGEWSVGELPAGNYTVQMAPPAGYFETTPTSVAVTLAYAQAISNLQFGLSNQLPANTVSNFQVTRTDNRVTVEWIITRNEVQTVAIERSTQIGGQFTSVGELQIQVMGTNTLIRVTDQLPEELADVTVYYQLRVQPTNLVVGPTISLGSAGIHQIFLPMTLRY